MMRPRTFLVLALLVLLAVPVHAQPADGDTITVTTRRPIPYPVIPNGPFQRALQSGTRTPSGAPGEGYWTNTAHYDIEASIDTSARTLTGAAQIRYQNNSPDTLRQVALHLRQNVYKEGVIRNRSVEVTGGMTVQAMGLEGESLEEVRTRRQLQRLGQGYVIDGTRLLVFLRDPLPPSDSLNLSIDWDFQIPGDGNFRMGQDGEVYYLGYWYPQMAVYDDLRGWTAQPYQGNGEFYMGYADYDVSITVPEGFLVGATGTLQNPDAVLPADVQSRLEQARTDTSIVNVVAADQRGTGSATVDSESDSLTWTYRAENVRDFAFGTSDRYVWDAAHAETGDGSSMVHSFYRPDVANWERSAEYARYSVEHLSEMLVPYPYPHMTLVEGIIGGGMEYPMITLIGGARTPESLFGVTYHEISHMWVPMMVGTNEKAYAWIDEGTTSFNTSEGEGDFYEKDGWAMQEHWYYRYAGTEADAPSMRHSDQYPTDSPARVLASYDKPAVMLHALRTVLGDETFFEAYQTFVQNWTNKHPTPYDLFNTFEEVSGRDLDWFWTGAFYETWVMDHAIQDVEQTDNGVNVTVADLGRLVMPVIVQATYEDGRTVTKRAGVEAWMNGARETVVTLEPGTVTQVILNPGNDLPDVNPTNNDWSVNGPTESSTRVGN